MKAISILITCHNRRQNTINCLNSIYNSIISEDYQFEVFLVDDGSTDGTYEEIKNSFPQVNLISGNGNLFWAGGMRLAWQTAMKKQKFDAFLLLNDDVILDYNFLSKFIETEIFSLEKTNTRGIYVGTTVDDFGNISYGGYLLKTNHLIVKSERIVPSNIPQNCHFTNANILWVSYEVTEKIGIFDNKFTHGIADYDYSLRAVRKGIPVYVTPGICGRCTNDHRINWSSSDITLKKRIAFLKNPKGLAYSEYLFYIRRHFLLNYPYSFVMLWLKTLFPQLWEKYKTL